MRRGLGMKKKIIDDFFRYFRPERGVFKDYFWGYLRIFLGDDFYIHATNPDAKMILENYSRFICPCKCGEECIYYKEKKCREEIRSMEERKFPAPCYWLNFACEAKIQLFEKVRIYDESWIEKNIDKKDYIANSLYGSKKDGETYIYIPQHTAKTINYFFNAITKSENLTHNS